jgi:hypothetical protein
MPELTFRVRDAAVMAYAATPAIGLRVEIRVAPAGSRVESILLRCAVRIDAGARAHTAGEQARLKELFGDASVWSRSARSLLWTQTTAVVAGFDELCEIEVPLPCSYDLAAAASKYLRALEAGEVPITAQFSGTLFYAAPSSSVRVELIPWDREASFRLPAELFQQAIERHFPDSGVVSLRRDLFDRLDRYRVEQGLSGWEQALERLLALAQPGGAA